MSKTQVLMVLLTSVIVVGVVLGLARIYIPFLDNFLISYIDDRVAWAILTAQTNLQIISVYVGTVVTAIGLAFRQLNGAKQQGAQMVSSVTSQASSQISQVQGEKEALLSQYTDAKGEVESLRVQNTQIIEESKILSSQFQVQNTQISELNGKILTVTEEKNALIGQVGELKTRLAELQRVSFE